MPARPYHIPCHVRHSIPYARQAITYTMSCPPGHTIYHAMSIQVIPYTMSCPPRPYHIPCHACYGKGPKFLVTISHPVNYIYMWTVSIRLHVKVSLRISIGGIAKRSGFFVMCVGYDGMVLIPLWFIHEDSHLVNKTTQKW